MTFGRVVFIIVVLILLWHFRHSLPIDRSDGLGVVAGKTSPKAVRGTFVLTDDAGKPTIFLRFVDDTHFQKSTDGKTWGPVLDYNMFDDKLYLHFQKNDVWTMEVRGQTIYRSDLHQTFKFVGP